MLTSIWSIFKHQPWSITPQTKGAWRSTPMVQGGAAAVVEVGDQDVVAEEAGEEITAAKITIISMVGADIDNPCRTKRI
eukprot:1545851-Ditylum_brightwellii.AAC.1